MKNEGYEKLLGKALFYLGIHIRSEFEMRQYLEKKSPLVGAHSDDIERVIVRLKELKYLNDNDFVEAYVRSRNNSKQKGEYVIRQELKRKGIPDAVVDHFFDINEQDAVGLAKIAIEKRWHTYSTLDSQKRRKRAQDFLMRRGFSYDVIREVLEWAHTNL